MKTLAPIPLRFVRITLLSTVPLAVLMAVLLAARAADAQQPVVHYTFDESDGDALDTGTPPPANGMLRSNATRTSNTPGGFSPFALDLSAEGLESWIDAGDVAKVDTLAQFTMTSWIYLKGLNSDQPGSSNNVRVLAKQANTVNFDGFSWNFNAPAEGEVAPDNFRLGMFVGGVNGFSFGQSTEDLGADNRWVFIATTYDGVSDEDNLLFFVGDETSEVRLLGDPLSVLAGEVNSSAGIARLAIGYTDANTTVDFAINGYQDDVRIYDQVLSIEQIEQIRLANLQSVLEGDFNQNSVLDAADIDDLTFQVASMTNNPVYDLNDDQAVDGDDIRVWVKDLFKSYIGDADTDHEFNSGDLVQVLASGTYEAEIDAVWSTGDFNGDGRTNSTDLVEALADGGYELGPPAVRAVPEPSSAILVAAACALLSCHRRRTGTAARHEPSDGKQ